MRGSEHRILLVGPWRPGPGGGGGCCSAGPEGIGCQHAHDPSAAQDRPSNDAGAAVRALRSSAGPSVDVQLVDPRNTVYLLPAVYRDARAAGVGRGPAAMTAIRATTPWTLVVDGTIVSRAVPLDPASALGHCSPHVAP